MEKKATKIVDLLVEDVRFPTSLELDGSDATHPDPDYSAVYVTLVTDSEDFKGYGITFTLGRGNEIVLHCVDSLRFLVINKDIKEIQANMGSWVRSLAHESQLRWIGPEKGPLHLAVAGIVNSFWDLWGKMESKPVWKLLVDMTPEQLVSLVDFRYMEDCITKDEAIEMLQKEVPMKSKREVHIRMSGFPAYTTQVGWLGYSDEKIRTLSKIFLDRGFTAFKMKVGSDLEDDKRRLSILRECIGWEHLVMVDANQKWSVPEAIEWMKELAQFKLHWIEEPTSPDDILGHLEISKALKEHGIGVATGEVCQNRVMFKQFLASGGMQFCQIDSGRMAGVNEVIGVYLMAKKLNVPVCPHAGGVGLCEMVQHLQMFDYVALSGTTENRMIEYVDHLHEHFKSPPKMGPSKYYPPTDPGYSTEMFPESVDKFSYPNGEIWKDLFSSGKYQDLSRIHKRLV